MKKLFLLITFVSMSYSCSDTDSLKIEQTNIIDYSALNISVDKQINSFHKMAINSNNAGNYLKYFKTETSALNTGKSIPEETNIKITLAPHYNYKEQKFMLLFYQDLANCYDNKIVDLLNSKRISLNEDNFSADFKNEATFIFNTIEKVTNEIGMLLNKSQTNKTKKETGFGNCMGQKGKSIGRAVAAGALVGAVGGAIVGAGGGTVALPGIGTTVGAVGGAVFGAVKGAIGGGLVELTWAAVDCVMQPTKLEAKYLNTEDFYREIVVKNDPDQLDFYIFKNADALINTVLNASENTIIKFTK